MSGSRRRPRLTSLPPDAADAEGAAPLQLHYAEMAAAAAAAAGASAAVAYCHVRRSAQEKVVRGAAGGLYGFYAHTDQARGGAYESRQRLTRSHHT